MPLKTFSQTSMIVGKTDAVCTNDDGEIKVQILTGIPDFYITLTKGGSALQFTQGPVGLGSYVFNNLEAGDYTVTVVDGNSQSVMQGIVVEDDANWPLAFYTSEEGRSNGVDVKTADNEDVIAAGIFLGELQIDQANNSQLFNSNGQKNIYVVHFSKCGYIKWEKQIGNGSADCFVKAINLDPVTQDVYICGDLIGGVIFFEGMNGSILAIANPSSLYREGFLARLDAATGNCLWVSRIANGPASARDINAEGICVDENGLAYVFGDFMASNVVFYNSNNLPSLINVSNLGIDADNYLVVYDNLGFPLTAENTILSSNLNDEAGAVDCYPNSLVSGSANILITGSMAGSFLGQLWVYDPSGNTLSIESSLSVGAGSMYFGKSVETLPTSAAIRHAYISGWVNHTNGGSHPFLARWELSTSNNIVIPYSQKYDFVNTTTQRINKSTDIDLNMNNGDVYFVGILNETGQHPLFGSLTIPTTGIPPSEDLFVDKFKTAIGVIGPQPIAYAWSDSHNCTFGFFNDLPAFAISSDNDGKAYMTGGFSGNQLSFPANQGVPVIGGGNTTAYMARLGEQSGSLWIKNQEFSSSSLAEERISIVPNPSVSGILVKGIKSEGSYTHLRIYGTDGVLYRNERIVIQENNQVYVDIRQLSSGFYILEISGAGVKAYARFVKQ